VTQSSPHGRRPETKVVVVKNTPRINAHELGDRYNEFLRQVREASKPPFDPDASGAAQRDLVAWFAERGVNLVFPDGFDDGGR
jgi:hypothetical protein